MEINTFQKKSNRENNKAAASEHTNESSGNQCAQGHSGEAAASFSRNRSDNLIEHAVNSVQQFQFQSPIQRKLANNQATLQNGDLPASIIPQTSTTQSGPYSVPLDVKADLGKRVQGQEPNNGGELWTAVSDRNRQILALPDEAIYDRAHILANTFGGSGNFPNIVPTTADFNRNQMWTLTEDPLYQARQTPYRVFRYEVDVEYGTHPLTDSMIYAETYLPTAFNFNIKEYRFKGNNTESSDWSNWELTDGTTAAGAQVNYSAHLAHTPDFANFPAFKRKQGTWINFNDPQSIRNNREPQTSEERKNFRQQKNDSFRVNYYTPFADRLRLLFQQQKATNLNGTITDSPEGRTALSLAEAQCKRMKIATANLEQNLSSFPNCVKQVRVIGEFVLELQHYFANAKENGSFNPKTVASFLKDIQQLMADKPLELVPFDEQAEIDALFKGAK